MSRPEVEAWCSRLHEKRRLPNTQRSLLDVERAEVVHRVHAAVAVELDARPVGVVPALVDDGVDALGRALDGDHGILRRADLDDAARLRARSNVSIARLQLHAQV